MKGAWPTVCQLVLLGWSASAGWREGAWLTGAECEDRIGTGPPRARTEVIYVELGCWAISGNKFSSVQKFKLISVQTENDADLWAYHSGREKYVFQMWGYYICTSHGRVSADIRWLTCHA